MENFSTLEWLAKDPLKSLYQEKRKKLSLGESIYDLSMINPDLEPAPLALDKLTEAILKPGQHRYAVSRGIRKLREAFALKYADAFNVSLDPELEICVCLGTKDAISVLLSYLCRHSHRVLVGAPCYPMYRSAAELMKLDVSFFDIQPDESRMLASIEHKLETFEPAVLLLNFPNNPTGITVSRDFYSQLGGLIAKRNCWILNDFVYGEMGFDAHFQPSVLAEPSLRDRAFETYSLSKAYSIPGWRIGAVAGNRSVIPWISKLKSHVDYGAFLPLQVASCALLSSSADLVAPVIRAYKGRAQLLAQGLQRLGWDPLIPGAGASLWAKIPEIFGNKGSVQLAEELLSTVNVVLLPGVVFGEEFDRYLRFALVNSEERIREVLLRLEAFSYDKGR